MEAGCGKKRSWVSRAWNTERLPVRVAEVLRRGSGGTAVETQRQPLAESEPNDKAIAGSVVREGRVSDSNSKVAHSLFDGLVDPKVLVQAGDLENLADLGSDGAQLQLTAHGLQPFLQRDEPPQGGG